MPRSKKLNNKVVTNEQTKWYEVIPKSMLLDVPNPSFDHHHISLPCRIILAGCSGASKSQCILEIIWRMPDTFSHIILCCQNSNEPLYQFLKSKLGEDLTIHEGIENVPDLAELEHGKDHHTLLIFDDLCLSKNQKKIEEAFIRGRKVPASVIYSTQSYFAVPKVCRLNSTHIILKKLSTTRDLKMILSDHTLGVSREELIAMYQRCTEKQGDFLMIATTDPAGQKFRHNFLDIIPVEDKDEAV